MPWHASCSIFAFDSESQVLFARCSVPIMALKWPKEEKLKEHHQKRIEIDEGCFEELLDTPHDPVTGKRQPMTLKQYEMRSFEAKDNAWGSYDAEHKEEGEWIERRSYFVDKQLVVAITDHTQQRFITCFHEHLAFMEAGHSEVVAMDDGERILRYKEMLESDEENKLVRNLKWRYGNN